MSLNNKPLPNNSCVISKLPTPTWEWDFFGNGNFIIYLNNEVKWIARVTTRIFLGSKWRRP